MENSDRGGVVVVVAGLGWDGGLTKLLCCVYLSSLFVDMDGVVLSSDLQG